MTLHLTVDEAKHFMGRYGFFVRDEGLLASAVARPGTSITGAGKQRRLHYRGLERASS